MGQSAGDDAVLDHALGVVDDARAAVEWERDDARADGAEEAADGMDAEHVERVVVAERALHRGDEEEAHHAGHRAEHQARPSAQRNRKPA